MRFKYATNVFGDSLNTSLEDSSSSAINTLVSAREPLLAYVTCCNLYKYQSSYRVNCIIKSRIYNIVSIYKL